MDAAVDMVTHRVADGAARRESAVALSMVRARQAATAARTMNVPGRRFQGHFGWISRGLRVASSSEFVGRRRPALLNSTQGSTREIIAGHSVYVYCNLYGLGVTSITDHGVEGLEDILGETAVKRREGCHPLTPHGHGGRQSQVVKCHTRSVEMNITAPCHSVHTVHYHTTSHIRGSNPTHPTPSHSPPQ